MRNSEIVTEIGHTSLRYAYFWCIGSRGFHQNTRNRWEMLGQDDLWFISNPRMTSLHGNSLIHCWPFVRGILWPLLTLMAVCESIAGPLWGESTGHGWIPVIAKDSDDSMTGKHFSALVRPLWGKPQVTSGFPSQRTSSEELWSSLSTWLNCLTTCPILGYLGHHMTLLGWSYPVITNIYFLFHSKVFHKLYKIR